MEMINKNYKQGTLKNLVLTFQDAQVTFAELHAQVQGICK